MASAFDAAIPSPMTAAADSSGDGDTGLSFPFFLPGHCNGRGSAGNAHAEFPSGAKRFSLRLKRLFQNGERFGTHAVQRGEIAFPRAR